MKTKNRRFVDLSIDENISNKEVVSIVHDTFAKKDEKDRKKIKLTNNSKKSVTTENSDFEERNKTAQKNNFIGNQQSENKHVESVYDIPREPLLNQPVHFYTEARVYKKLKLLAKKNNISISKLLTLIIDKSISVDE